MKGRINKRVDNLLYILMKISRDKAFDRLCKLQKGKISGRLTTIRKRRWESSYQTLSYQSISKDGKEWNVKSADGRQEYSVVCEHDACQQKCQIVCNYCQVCIHMYTCTCMDFLIYHTICKRIHLICSNRQGRLNITLPATSMQDIGIPETKPLLHSSTPEKKLKKIKDRIHKSLSRISVCMASCTCENDLHLAENHVLSAVNILELSLSNYKGASLLPIMENHPDNKKIQTQRFYSTRKRRKRHTTRLVKPSEKQKLAIIKCLSAKTSLYRMESEG